MLKNETLELGKLVRLRATVAKGEVDKRIARCLADVEAQLAASYPSNHEAWAEVTAETFEATINRDIASVANATDATDATLPVSGRHRCARG